MLNCAEPGSRVWVDLHQRPGRKLPGTWELVETAPGELACVHSARANAVVAAGLEAGLITPLAGIQGVRREVTLAAGGSQGDFPTHTRSEEHTSELQSRPHLVCRLLLEKKNRYSKSEYA